MKGNDFLKQLTILVDIDDTLEDLCTPWVQYLNEKYGTAVTTDDIKDWHIAKVFPTLTREQVFEPLAKEEFWERVKPLPEAYKNIRKLKYDGHRIFIVTASDPIISVPMKLEKVLFRYFPFFSCNDVIIATQKQMIRGDILVDDASHNLENGNYKRILMNAPHNRFFNEKSIGAARACDWDTVYRLISKYACEKYQNPMLLCSCS